MNAFTLALAALINRPWQTVLNLAATAAAIALLSCLFLLSSAIEEGLSRNLQGIDIVVGAKGSPTQLVLSSVYQADIPNGNIDMADYEILTRHPQVREAIPLAIGDNYQGWRIVGTTPDYLKNYHAVPASGRLFASPFEAVAGSATMLKMGEEFAARHGFADDEDDIHDFHLYKIVGVLKPTGTVIDRLITTDFKSVQELHGPHENAHHHDSDRGHDDDDEDTALGHQITAVLIKVKSPVAIINLPREINRQNHVMATSPGYQMARLSQNMGIGKTVLTAIGGIGLAFALLMLASAIASNLSSRRYDLAVLRVMGGSRRLLFMTVILEGTTLSAAGSLAGLIAGHAACFGVLSAFPNLSGFASAETLLRPGRVDAVLFATGIAAGILAGIVPAFSAARTDIASLLAKGKN